MSEIIFSLPLIVSFFISPLLSPLRIIQCLIAFVAVAEPYLAGSIMILLSPIIYYKTFINQEFIATSDFKKIFIFFALWLGYSIITVLWLPDFGRFITEIVQLILILSLALVFIYNLRFYSDLISTNNFFAICGILVTIKSVYDSYQPQFTPINYFAFISVITCIVLPVTFLGYKAFTYFEAILLILIAFIGISVNESRGSTLLGILVILIRFFILNDFSAKIKRVMMVLFVIITPIASFVYYQFNEDNILRSVLDVERNYSNLERLSLVNQSIDVFSKNLLGVGYGSTNSIFISTASYTDSSYPHPHNTLAHFAVELGLVGLTVFFALFYFILLSIKKSRPFKEVSIESNQVFKAAILFLIVLFLFSFLDDMLFNGMFSFYCLFFFAFAFSFINIFQHTDTVEQ